MKKKIYIQPEVSVSRMETINVICVSMPKSDAGGDPLLAV